MNERYEKNKAWLRRYQESIREEQLLMEEIEQLKSEAARITPCLSTVPGGGGQGDGLPRAVEKLMEAQQRLECQIKCSCKARVEIVKVLKEVKNVQEREILMRRYLLRRRWEEISKEMSMSKRWLLKQHRKAVEELHIPSKEDTQRH